MTAFDGLADQRLPERLDSARAPADDGASLFAHCPCPHSRSICATSSIRCPMPSIWWNTSMKTTTFLTSIVAALGIIAICSTSLFAQLKVGNNPGTLNTNAALEVETSNKGLLLPRVALNSTTSVAPMSAHVSGMIVFNTATANDVTPGFYYDDGNKWVKISPAATEGSNTIIYSDPINAQCLGAVPSSTSTATLAPASFSYGGYVFNKVVTYNYNGNGHSYAVFVNQSQTPVNWFTAKDAAASLGGYLATFTKYNEWKSFHANSLAITSSLDDVSLWFGMARSGYGTGWFSDNISWITCEQSERFYSVGNDTRIFMYSNFKSGEPNGTGNEGFVHTYTKNNVGITTPFGPGTTHGWNDSPANGLGTGFIVEFQQQ